MLMRCLSDLLLKTDYDPIEVLVVQVESDACQPSVAFDRLENSGLIRTLSSLATSSCQARNMLVEQARGHVVLILDGSLTLRDSHSLSELISQASRPGVGLAGPLLVGGKDRIYEAGIILGARRAATPVDREFAGYFGLFALTRDVSALSSSCLAFRRSVYREAGGMVAGSSQMESDVNFSLRVKRMGLRNVLTPNAEALGQGSDAGTEIREMPVHAEPPVLDPFYNPNLSLDALFTETSNPSRRVKPWAEIRNRLIIRGGQAHRVKMLMAGVPPDAKILEIGASYSPIAPRAEDWDTSIVDHATRAELVEKYKREPDVWVDRIEEVDFVWKEGSIADAIPANLHGTFDALIASHVIEHVPDLISFLGAAERILSKGGSVILAVPDKRFCFDYFRPLSMCGDILEANEEKRSRHTRRTAYEHWFYTILKNGVGAWGQEQVASVGFSNPFGVALSKLDALRNSPEDPYVDLHVWKFTPSNFELILFELARMEKTDWWIERITPAMGCEFHVRLGRGGLDKASHLTGQEFDARRLQLLTRILAEQGQQYEFAADLLKSSA